MGGFRLEFLGQFQVRFAVAQLLHFAVRPEQTEICDDDEFRVHKWLGKSAVGKMSLGLVLARPFRNPQARHLTFVIPPGSGWRGVRQGTSQRALLSLSKPSSDCSRRSTGSFPAASFAQSPENDLMVRQANRSEGVSKKRWFITVLRQGTCFEHHPG